MEHIIRGDKVEITKAIEKYIIEKLKKLDKYFLEPEKINAHILIRVRGRQQKIEITIPIKKHVLRIEEEADDLYGAIDLAVTRMEEQIRRNKNKIQDRHKRDNIHPMLTESADEILKKDEKTIIKRKNIEINPMDEEEAILEMELLDHSFHIFKDRRTDIICVLYKRKDGNYGIIETK